MQITSWFKLPRVPRICTKWFMPPSGLLECGQHALLSDHAIFGLTFVGDTSEMYKGTSAEDKPMPRPTKRRPATIMVRLLAVAESRLPMSIGRLANSSAFFRPRLGPSRSQHPDLKRPSHGH